MIASNNTISRTALKNAGWANRGVPTRTPNVGTLRFAHPTGATTKEEMANPSIGAVFRAFLLGNSRQSWSLPILCCFFAFAVHAQTPTPEMPPMAPELELRLKKLETELRCLVCQNQTLADSPAGLAGDLRREIRMLADQNKSNEEIKEHLRVRYGDFVLYRPPVDNKTYLLWFGPFSLLIGGGLLLWFMSRRRAKTLQSAAPISATDQARANAMLKDE
jgi:cytochrome c-type biogenesis protein CcmH